MVLLNTTFCIAPADHRIFRDWVDRVYIPEITRLENHECKLLRIDAPAEDSLSFAVQFVLEDSETAGKWLQTTQPSLISRSFSKEFGLSPERLLHFSTIMEIL